MNNKNSQSINIGGNVQSISSHTISGTNIQQYFISANDTEDKIHKRPFIQVSPYLGLNKFEPDDKDRFFGREKWITKLSDLLLNQAHILLLLGASGSGKSSLIRAGVIPYLKDNWGSFFNLTLRPDKNPFECLYQCLTPYYNQSEPKIARRIKEDTLIQVSNYLKKDARWLIFIDQFEEIFTTTPKLH